MDLEVAWNGQMERDGDAPGLSVYQGRSSLYHSPGWSQESLEYGEVERHPNRGRPLGSKNGANHARALELLRGGLDCSAVARRLAISSSIVRYVARREGLSALVRVRVAPVPVTDDQRVQAKALLRTGWSLRRVSERVGISVKQVRTVARYLGAV